MNEYGFMPDQRCVRCQGRWPTRYQYEVIIHGPDGSVTVYLCSQCWAYLLGARARAFNRTYGGGPGHVA